MVDIVVVPRDRFSTFPRCLDALYAHTTERFRLFVIAGGVDPATERYLRTLERERENIHLVLVGHLLKQAEARNIGFRLVSERLCVVLENDTIVHKGWLPPLLACMREEAAAAVMPLVLWYRGIHAAGAMFEEREKKGERVLRHDILYSGIHRKTIGYPECHCILLDRQLLPSGDLFDEVEPFDVDLGLTLKKHGHRAFFEPASVVTYAAPPPWEVRDIEYFKLRWDPASWLERNQLFMKKWNVVYDRSEKTEKYASYIRQQIKLGLARWYPTEATVGLSNVLVGSAYRFLSSVRWGRSWRNPPPRYAR